MNHKHPVTLTLKTKTLLWAPRNLPGLENVDSSHSDVMDQILFYVLGLQGFKHAFSTEL